MLTEQEQEILDNAPEGAVTLITTGPYWGKEMDEDERNTLAKDVDDEYVMGSGDCEHGGTPRMSPSGWVVRYDLADLRKKQGKTVVDAVNYLQAELTADNCHHTSNEDETLIYNGSRYIAMKRENIGHVCTIEEFNQCVKEMSEHNCALPFCTYKETTNKQLLTKESSDYSFYESVKPRMKVEYVKEKAVFFWKVAKDFSEKADFFDVHSNRINTLEGLLGAYKCDDLYRKVETEIKTEKRWIVYEDGKFKCEICEPPTEYDNANYQIIEITVEV
jgi:hypothetical protein